MHHVAQELRFEEAAVLRDRINALLKLRERQRVVLKRKSNLDLFALARAGTMALAVVHEIREGYWVGQRILPLAGVDNETGLSQIMEAVVTQYYLVSQRAPSRVLLSVMPTGKSDIEDWLSCMTGRAVRLMVRKGGIGGDLVKSALRNANVALEEEIAKEGSWDRRVPESLIRLGELLSTSPPRIIVGMDVSNLSGKESVGSVVVFREGEPWKQKYRRYKLGEEFLDDTERLHSMASRWAKKAVSGEHPPASVLLVDGGRGQVSAVSEAIGESMLSKKPMIVGLAKKEELLHIETEETSTKLRRDDEGLQLLQRIRDEAHRFAVGYHRSVRRKKLFRDPLEEIPGVGKARALALRRRFGGMEGLRSASLDDIVSIAGIGPRLAKAIQSTIEGG
jgi:excinuclease ABC subunit C